MNNTTEERTKFVCDWINRNNYTYASAAELLGVSVATISRYFIKTKNRRSPSPTVVKLVELLTLYQR